MLIVGNWKAYVQTETKARKLFAVAKKLSKKPDIQIVIAPPAPYIGILAPGNRSKVAFASQDLSLSAGGATTGEIPAALLSDLGVKYAILGHSERRALGETDVTVAEKVRHAFANKITPIVCIGERERDIDAKYLAFLRAQIHAVFEPLGPKERQQVILAYEPIWAIGKTASDALMPTDLTEMVLYIQKILGDYLPGRSVQDIEIIYGGSVEPANIVALSQDTGIDGFLPGHASADPDVFSALVKAL
jgi:triosephosphate isomerase (TIM)